MIAFDGAVMVLALIGMGILLIGGSLGLIPSAIAALGFIILILVGAWAACDLEARERRGS